MDILLGEDGDLQFSNGDIIIRNSLSQKIRIRLKWFIEEWRWDKEMGLPYFEHLLVKNPDINYFEELGKEEIFKIDEITNVEVTILTDLETRKASISFVAKTDLETIRDEVVINGV